jgi:putative flippase GtrA
MSFVVDVIVQIFAYVVDFSIYATFLFAVGFPPLLSNVISKVAAACFAFFSHRTYTFGESAGDGTVRQALLYAG